MHKLDRQSVSAPKCLERLERRRLTWDRVQMRDKDEIRESLIQLQGPRCAYCEASVPTPEDRHIDHFRKRDDFPLQTYRWENLFLSCDLDDRCGRLKDTQRFLVDDLLKPDRDSPDAYLRFHSDGEVRPKQGLATAAARRASETIRVLNLSATRFSRDRALKPYRERLVEILEAADDSERPAIIQSEIEASRNEPHCTAIRHFLEEAI